MSIWKITTEGAVKIPETKLKREKILEEKLEDWIINDSSILGEPLFIIGRQVMIPEVRDRLDILALDPQGKAVIIELKRGKLKDPVDMQALRYASYISKWTFEDFESRARSFQKVNQDQDYNFNEEFEKFCTNANVDETPDINSDQRLLIVGSEVKDKLGSVALWLHEHSIDIKVIELEVYREDDSIFIQPQVIIPLPVSRFKEVGGVSKADGLKPWITDGKSWHLEKRCSHKTRDMLSQLIELIQDNFDVEGPRWNQKLYVAFKVNIYNWLSIRTHPSALVLVFLVKANKFVRAEVAQHLNVEEFDQEESLSEKLGLPSSVNVKNRNEQTDRVILRIKEDFDTENPKFLDFLQKTYEEFPK